MTESPHVIVVGGGFLGVCAALHLQAEGWRVTLLERGEIGEGASFGNASVLASGGVDPVAEPGILWQVPGMLFDPLGPLRLRWSYLPRMSGWLLRFLAASRPGRVEEISLALAALLGDSVEETQALAAAHGLEGHIRRQGWLTVYASKAAYAAAQPTIALKRRRGVRVEELGPAELRQMEPALAPDLAAGTYLPDVGQLLQSYDFLRGLAEVFQSNGGQVRKGEARGFVRSDGRVTGVETEAGKLACDAVVVAAGAWSKPLARQLGARIPLDTERGYHLSIPDSGIELARPVCDSASGMVCTSLSDGLRLAGTVELGGLNAAPDWRRAEALAAHGKRLLPGLKTEGASRWIGFRPSMPDSLPVISLAPGQHNVALAFGHGHLGVTLAAKTGKLVAALLSGRDPGIDMRPYAADRF
ncbi:MAG: FAD-dependent oxidoreductase [Rhodovibrionaceae bacterium]